MRQLVVGVGDGGVSRDPDVLIVTYALGSCVAVMLHDPVTRVSGLVHYMLPEIDDVQRANARPALDVRGYGYLMSAARCSGPGGG